MFRKALALPIFLILDFCITAKAQQAVTVPVLFNQYFTNFYLVNPAIYDPSYKFRAVAGDHSQTGLFQGVSRIVVDADLGLKAQREGTFHYVGIQAINDREGEFFSKSRLYGRYSWSTRISSTASLSAGASIGFVDYAFKASQAGAGGSALVPDGNAGMWFLSRKLKAGLAVQQMFNQKLTPIRQTFRLTRIVNANVSWLLDLQPGLYLSTYAYAGFQRSAPFVFDVAPVFTIQEKWDAGVSYRYRRGIAFIAGFKKIAVGSSQFSMYFSYLFSTSQVALNDNALELNLSFQKNRR